MTLACDDDQIQAHKVIPSACSPLFQNVLRHNPRQLQHAGQGFYRNVKHFFRLYLTHNVPTLENAVREFFTRWVAGLQPSLLLETNANGEILVSSRVSAPDYCHQTGQEDDQPPRQGHRHRRRCPPGPARLRRRARHAYARAAAANAATTTDNTAAVKAVSMNKRGKRNERKNERSSTK